MPPARRSIFCPTPRTARSLAARPGPPSAPVSRPVPRLRGVGPVKCSKPDAAIYELACRTGGFAPSEAVFIDDVMANVAGARATGMMAIHHTSAAQTAAELRALGLAA